jgi:hypothetical protein
MFPSPNQVSPDIDESWFHESASRQTTGTTVATEDDIHVSLDKPLLYGVGGASAHRYSRTSKAENLVGNLSVLKEQRGWKHFFRHVMAIPCAFVGGIFIGVMATLLVFAWFAVDKVGSGLPHQQGAYQLTPPPYEVPQAYLESKPLDNSCLIPKLSFPSSKPQTFDACAFVVKSTDEVWNLRGDVEEAIEKYFHEEYVDAGSWGKRIIGKKALKDAVLSEMRAFPDIQIHITDCVCRGNDVDGYKCAMPDVLTGTNLGPSGYGPATGKRAKWTGMVESLVKRNPKTDQWQYYAEWGVHDEWSLLQQLGLDFARIPHVPANIEVLHDCDPLVQFAWNSTSIDEPDKAEQLLHESRLFPSA